MNLHHDRLSTQHFFYTQIQKEYWLLVVVMALLEKSMRHKNVETCVMVEIDQMVIDACIAHIPQQPWLFPILKWIYVWKMELFLQKSIEKSFQWTLEPFDIIWWIQRTQFQPSHCLTFHL